MQNNTQMFSSFQKNLGLNGKIMNVIVTTQIQCVRTTSFDLAHTYIQVQNFTI